MIRFGFRLTFLRDPSWRFTGLAGALLTVLPSPNLLFFRVLPGVPPVSFLLTFLFQKAMEIGRLENAPGTFLVSFLGAAPALLPSRNGNF